jgi:hypothetical protein
VRGCGGRDSGRRSRESHELHVKELGDEEQRGSHVSLVEVKLVRAEPFLGSGSDERAVSDLQQRWEMLE